MTSAFFVSGARTPFTRAFKGAFAEVRPDDMLVELIALCQARQPERFGMPPEDFLVGCAYPEGEQGFNVARSVALGAGLDVPAAVVSRLCASSLEAVILAAGCVRAGFNKRVWVGGVESMSRIPRRGAGFTGSARIEAVAPHAYIAMGETAERVAERYRLSRAVQEAVACDSHRKAAAAYEAGFYTDHVWPVAGSGSRDESLRATVDTAKLAALPPAFRPDGTVTAATSSPLSDGAALGMVVDAETAAAVRAATGTGTLEILDAARAAVAPEVMGLGPIAAITTLLSRANVPVDAISAWEVNEAFASQVLANRGDLKLPAERVNAWGGALALGHPLGASGLRLMLTLERRLHREGERGDLGVAALCVGGGQGVAILLRRP